jgi:hypothetical protein
MLPVGPSDGADRLAVFTAGYRWEKKAKCVRGAHGKSGMCVYVAE